jgi:hypothetical protein
MHDKQAKIKKVLSTLQSSDKVDSQEINDFSLDDLFFYDTENPNSFLAIAIGKNLWPILGAIQQKFANQIDYSRKVNNQNVSLAWFILGGGSLLRDLSKMTKEREDFFRAIPESAWANLDLNWRLSSEKDIDQGVSLAWLLAFWYEKFPGWIEKIYQKKLAQDSSFKMNLLAAPTDYLNLRKNTPVVYYLIANKRETFLGENCLLGIDLNIISLSTRAMNYNVDLTYLLISSESPERIELFRRMYQKLKTSQPNYSLNYNAGPLLNVHYEYGVTNLYLFTKLNMLDEFFVFTEGVKIDVNAGFKNSDHPDFGVTVLYLWGLKGRWDLIEKGIAGNYFKTEVIDVSAGPKKESHFGYNIDFAFLAAKAGKYTLLNKIVNIRDQGFSSVNLDAGPKNDSFPDFGYTTGYYLVENREYGLFKSFFMQGHLGEANVRGHLEKVKLRIFSVNLLTKPKNKPCLGALLVQAGRDQLLTELLSKHVGGGSCDLTTFSGVGIDRNYQDFFPGLIEGKNKLLNQAFDEFFTAIVNMSDPGKRKALSHLVLEKFPRQNLSKLLTIVSNELAKEMISQAITENMVRSPDDFLIKKQKSRFFVDNGGGVPPSPSNRQRRMSVSSMDVSSRSSSSSSSSSSTAGPSSTSGSNTVKTVGSFANRMAAVDGKGSSSASKSTTSSSSGYQPPASGSAKGKK